MRIQYGKCTNEDCSCTGRCGRSFKTHICLRHSDSEACLIPKSNKFKFLRRRLIRPLDDSIEVNNEVVDNIEHQEVIADTAINDIVTDVITKVVKVTKALIVVKTALTIDDPVVEVNANKRGRPTLAEAALKLDKLQQTQKTLPIISTCL
jgi:hypothetical protein